MSWPMAKRSSTRSQRTKRRKKKSDRTILIIALVGFAFLLILVVVYFSTNTPTVAKPKKTKPAPISDANEHPNNKERKKRNTIRLRAKGDKNKSPKDIALVPAFDPSCILSFPDQIELPKLEQQQKTLAMVAFPPEAKLDLDLHLSDQNPSNTIRILAAKPDATAKDRHFWRIAFKEADDEIATLQFDNSGVHFRWAENVQENTVSSLHNAHLIVRAGGHQKSMQLRQEQMAPNIRLFHRNSDRSYELTLPHAPSEPLQNISWALHPTSPDSEPFNIKQIGPCTTNGAIPLDKKLEWAPSNNHGIIQFRYSFSWRTGPVELPHEIALILKVKKQYQIGEKIRPGAWKDLTTTNIKNDYYEVINRYEETGTEYDELYNKLDPIFSRLSINFENKKSIALREEYILFPFHKPNSTTGERDRINDRRDEMLNKVRQRLYGKAALLKTFNRFIEKQNQILAIRELEGKYYVLLNQFYNSLDAHDVRLELTTPAKEKNAPIRLASYPAPQPGVSAPQNKQHSSESDEAWSIPASGNPFAGRFIRLKKQSGSKK